MSPEVIVFEVGAAQFGVQVDRVREVVRVPPITRIPFPAPSIAGVVSLRGAVIPVIDLGDLLLDQPSERNGRIVIVADEVTHSNVALLVDRVVDLVPGDLERLEPPAEVTASLPDGSIEAMIAPAPDRSVTLLNLDHVLGRFGRIAEKNR